MYIYIYIYVIMKTMCPSGYHHNGFVATHALGYMVCVCVCVCVCVYIYVYNAFLIEVD